MMHLLLRSTVVSLKDMYGGYGHTVDERRRVHMKDSTQNRADAVGQIHGRVKWFDTSKGFGFVVSEWTDEDILLHGNVLRNFGQNSVAEGAFIEVWVERTPRGMQATEVLAITPPDDTQILQFEELRDIDGAELDSCPLEPARVKWFDRSKGFGFANVFGRADDVFVHIEVLRRSGFADLQPGEALALRVINGTRGRMAFVAAPWESAVPEDEDA